MRLGASSWSLVTGRMTWLKLMVNQKENLWEMYSTILISTTSRSGACKFLFCLWQCLRVQHTPVRNLCHYMYWLSIGTELALVYIEQNLFGESWEPVLCRSAPLFENHYPRLRHKLSHCLKSVVSDKCHGKKSLSSSSNPSCFFCSHSWPFCELGGLPGGGFSREGLCRWTQVPSGSKHVKLLSLRVLLAPGGRRWKPFSHQSHVFLLKGLTVAPLLLYTQ